MIIDTKYPDELQFKPDKKVLDEAIVQAKAALLNDIKRSVYIYRCDLGGCNGCEIEIFSTITPVFDAERFGIKNTPSPRHADILVYTGAVTRAMRLPGIRAYEAAPDPKLIVSYGACGCTGGIFHDCYCTWGGTDKFFDVDVYIPGCPPSPAQTIYGFAIALGKLGQKLHAKHEQGSAKNAAKLKYSDIPYKLRTSIEREIRLYCGYVMGKDISDDFLKMLETEDDILTGIDKLVREDYDERKADVLYHMRDLIYSITIRPTYIKESDVSYGVNTVANPVGSLDYLYGRMAAGSVPENSEDEVSAFAAQNPMPVKDNEASE